LKFDPNYSSVRDDVGGGIKITNKIDKGYGTLNEKNVPLGLCGVEWDYEGRKCNDNGLKTFLVFNILFDFDLSL
jgi:hypothetical protein